MEQLFGIPLQVDMGIYRADVQAITHQVPAGVKRGMTGQRGAVPDMKSEEDHYRFDTEMALYEPLYNLMDLRPMVASYEYRVTNGESGEDVDLSGEYFEDFLNSTIIKNGFVIMVLELTKLNSQMREIKQRTRELISLIEEEIAR